MSLTEIQEQVIHRVTQATRPLCLPLQPRRPCLPANQRNALLQAAQTYLDTLQAVDTVQPGEDFVNLAKAAYLDTAQQPLKATLTFQLDTNASATATCLSVSPNIMQGVTQGCVGGNQNCHTLCSIPFNPNNVHSWDGVSAGV